MYSEDFLAVIESIQNDSNKKYDFVTTRQGSRMFDILSSNIKNLNTFYTYYEDVTFHPNIDNHQKVTCCKKLNVYGKRSNEEKIRGTMLYNFGRRFPESNSLARVFFVTLLLMNSDYNIHEGAEYLYAILPEDLLQDFDLHLGAFLQKTIDSIENPIMGIFALRSSEDALFAYVDMYENENNEFKKTSKKAENNNDCISRRIANCQRSTFPVEAMIFSLYTMFAQQEYNNKTYTEIVDVIVDAFKQKISSIGESNINNGTIYNVGSNDANKIKDFLLDLDSDEQFEILKCLDLQVKSKPTGNSISLKPKKSRKIKRPNKYYNNIGGQDVYKTCKERQGQNRFRNALLAQEEECCAISDCKIVGAEHLRASHIVAWKESSKSEKTDPNNGLLLCPNHDHLFDGYYISFDKQGRIMISNELSNEDRIAFGVNENIILDISPERELYMERHRKKLK